MKTITGRLYITLIDCCEKNKPIKYVDATHAFQSYFLPMANKNRGQGGGHILYYWNLLKSIIFKVCKYVNMWIWVPLIIDLPTPLSSTFELCNWPRTGAVNCYCTQQLQFPRASCNLPINFFVTIFRFGLQRNPGFQCKYSVKNGVDAPIERMTWLLLTAQLQQGYFCI